MKFKKGDAVTMISSYDSTGTVSVRHYLVTSWGKKQGTLIRKDDGSNAEFRVYAKDATLVQGIRSRRIIPTSEYSTILALNVAHEFVQDEQKRAADRYSNAMEKMAAPGYVPYAGTVQSNIDFEQMIWDKHNAVAWLPAVHE